MQIIKYFFALFALSALLWHPIYSADKYIYPILWIVLLWAGRKMGNKFAFGGGRRDKCIPTAVLLALIFLSNAIYIGKTAIKAVGNNIRYAQGDRYAGYPPTVKQMFLDFERARELPAGTRIVCRKPELLYITSGGRASEYPPGVSR